MNVLKAIFINSLLLHGFEAVSYTHQKVFVPFSCRAYVYAASPLFPFGIGRRDCGHSISKCPDQMEIYTPSAAAAYSLRSLASIVAFNSVAAAVSYLSIAIICCRKFYEFIDAYSCSDFGNNEWPKSNRAPRTQPKWNETRITAAGKCIHRKPKARQPAKKNK